ncbi:MAG: YkgJ family cysteine cluster protein [Myxococcales bacterium]|nr:YkgJ family cysteine cluster protein [Myxococcales bacterium]
MGPPELGAHVAARHYVRDGRRLVVLHDTRSEGIVELDARGWALVAAADGTRDVAGLVRAAEHAGQRVPAAEAGRFVAALTAAGLLVAASEPARAAAVAPAVSGAAADRPVEALPDFRLVCDGQGSCCRSYPTTLFSPVEAARARALAPEVLDGGADAAAVFTPERGARVLAGHGYAVAMVDGACAYLAPDRRCGLEVAGGPAGKPLGCRLFPASFVDDGVRVRVSVAPECACVLASARRGPAADGMGLVPAGARLRRDLEAAVAVTELPATVVLGAGTHAARDDFRAWCDALPWAGPGWRAVDVDVPAALWVLARQVETHGLGPPGALPGGGAALPDDASFAQLRAALADAVGRRQARDARMRAAHDLVRLGLGWLLRALGRLGRGLEPAPRDAVGEAFYVRALGFGLALTDEHVPLALALRDRALRLWLARALAAELAGSGVALPDPAFAEPIALVEALLRGHGLDAYRAAASS